MTIHPAFTTEFPPSDDTFTGRVMLLVATGQLDVDDFVAEVLDEPEEFFPDDPVAADLDEDRADDLVAQVIEAHRSVVTEPSADMQALMDAFDVLEAQGIALSWGDGFDAQEGADYGYEAAQELDDPQGYAFMTIQDLERAVLTGQLIVGFSDMSGDLGDEAAHVAQRIVDEFTTRGLKVTWSGSPDERITLAPFVYALPVDDE